VADLDLRTLISRWRTDPGGTYQTWFLWEERLKNFRSIRRGLAQVVKEIEAGSFGNVYKGSSLETVVRSIAEQRQIFKGADHAFLWKPKLRIPDIYESRENQLAFAHFLDACACCDDEPAILSAIHGLDQRKIKGLGPAAANLLYFLHPTLVSPFNTAIVEGYNRLTGSKMKLGRWDAYLAMRAGLIRLNAEHRDLLSNDLGAIAGLMFDLGSGRYAPPPREGDVAGRLAWEADLDRVRAEVASVSKLLKQAEQGDYTHTQVQAWLRDLGRSLGFQVFVASNDRGRPWREGRLGDGCVECLPETISQSAGADSVKLIDVLWLSGTGDHVVAAFEVEHTTSIYSGIVRLLDLALGAPANATQALFLVAPDDREKDVRAQLLRPAFQQVDRLNVRYLPYSELEQHREHIARFGEGMKAMFAIARELH